MTPLKQHNVFKTLTEEQKNAVFSDARVIGVDASAGSGKTRVLTARILRLLIEKQIDLNDIVAITFTEKASAEMKQRLRDAFREFATHANSQELTRWRWLEQQLESAHICTIHSFCSSILREYALKLGFDPDFRIIDEQENFLLLDKFIREQLLNHIENDANAFELAVELSIDGLIKIIRTLFENALSIIHWIEQTKYYSTPEKYAEAFVEHVKQSYEQLLLNFKKSLSIKLWILQLQQFENKLSNPEDSWEIRRKTLIEELNKIQQAENAVTVLNIIDKILNEKTKRTSRSEEDKTTTDQIKKIINKIKEQLKKIYITEWEDSYSKKVLTLNYKLIHLFEKLYQQWTQQKREEGWVNFDDLIYLTRIFLNQYPDICKEIAQKTKYIFVDEFQDTDREQAILINELLQASDNVSLFFVGDAKQSIYMFRGAEVKVFQNQQKTTDKVISLTKNFRSVPEIINFINTFFSNTNLLFDVEEPYQNMVPHRQPYQQPRVEFLFSPSPDDTTNNEDIYDIEAITIANRITDSIEKGTINIYDEQTNQLRGAQYGDFAILFRTTTHLYQYEKALRDLGIPYQVVSGRGFFEVEEVKDILNFIHILLNPYHDISLLSFLRGPFCGLSDEQIIRWRIYAPLYELILDNIPIPEQVSHDNAYIRVRTLYRTISNKKHLPVYELIQHIITETGYEAVLSAQSFGTQKIGNLQKLLALTNAYQETLPLNLYNYHRLINRLKSEILEGEADLNLEPQNAVILTTIHKAKGLEFPIVIIPDLHSSHKNRYLERIRFHRDIGISLSLDSEFSGELENKNSDKIPWQKIIELQNNFDTEQEYARLLYVALTRAKDYLILSANSQARNKQDTKSWLSFLSSCFPICNQNNEDNEHHLFHICEITKPEKIYSKTNVPKPKNKIIPDLVQPINLTYEQFLTEPISVTELLDWMFDDNGNQPSVKVLENEYNKYHAERGTLLHTLLYLWDFNNDKEPLLEHILSFTKNYLYIDNIENEIQSLIDKIRTNPVYNSLRTNVPLYREIPFLWKIEPITIKGTVDAVLSDGTIIDYKTGKNASEHAEKYWKQLQIYYYALSETNIKLNKILNLVYIDQQKYDIKIVDISEKQSLVLEMKNAIMKHILNNNKGKGV